MTSANINEKKLTLWLKHKLYPNDDFAVSQITVPGSGYSAITGLIDTVVNGKTEQLVLRLEKNGEHIFLGTDLGLQAKMMSILSQQKDIPVPSIRGFESDSRILGGQFIVMDRVAGESLPQNPAYYTAGLLTRISPKKRTQLWTEGVEAVAKINRLNWQQGFEFLNKPQYGKPGLDQYLGWLSAWRDEAMNNESNTVLDQAIATLLVEKPNNPHVDVLWGDSNPGNFMFSEAGHVTAVLDFEAAALGPAEIDIGWWLFIDSMINYGIEALAGIPDKATLLASYEAKLGRKVQSLAYYELLAAVRIGLVIARTVKLLIRSGRLPDNNQAATLNPVTQMLAARLGIEGIETSADYMAFTQAMSKH